jgi:WD40 repeat protein
VSLYDARTAQLLQRFETPQFSNDANGVTWSPDDRLVVSAHQDGTTWFWDVATAEAVRTLDPHSGWARGVAYSPDGRLLVTTGEDARSDVWATDDWQRLERLPCLPQALWSVSWSPDGRHFAVGAGTYDTTAPSTIFVWEVSGGPESD